MMKIDLLFTPLEICPERLSGRTAVVIDLFRATSCIAAGIDKGAKKIIPATTIDQALEKKRERGNSEKILLGGERKMQMIEGFDLDNSPFSYSTPQISGATIVMTTTNGTRALEGSARACAANVLVGAMVNATAVAMAAGALGRDITIVCAGRLDRYTAEDVLCGGVIIEKIAERHDAQLTDAAFSALYLYQENRDDIRSYLRKGCVHYGQLLEQGMADDVAYCLDIDRLNVTPTLDLSDSSIKIG